MSFDTEIEDEIQAKGLTAPRVTPDVIEELLGRIVPEFVNIGTSTFCHGFLDGKFLLTTGHSACVSPENFDEGIGRKIAFENMSKQAREKLWELEGYRLYRDQRGDINTFAEEQLKWHASMKNDLLDLLKISDPSNIVAHVKGLLQAKRIPTTKGGDPNGSTQEG